jgi:hypothetical protein
LKAALQVLRTENAHLKAQGVLNTILDMPTLLDIPPVPELVHATVPSSPSSSDEVLMTPIAPSKRRRVPGDKALWCEMIDFQTDATIIDISRIRPGTAWLPQKSLPEIQLFEREKKGNALRRRAERRTRQIGNAL